MKENRDWRVRWMRPALCALGLLLLVAAIPGRTFASLGDKLDSVQADQVHMQASLRTIPGESHVVQELRAPSGIVVREYVSAGGDVFAVAWQGPWLPDMRQLLGKHFEDYQRALQAQSNGRPGRRPVHVETRGLVVQVAGHPRSFAGRAYVPEMLPPGVTPEDIR